MTRRLEAMGQEKYAGLVNPGKKHFNGIVRLHEDALAGPLRRKKPTTYFVNSMSDTFHEGVPFEFIDRMFAMMAMCPQHTFQVLTKRADRLHQYLNQTHERRANIGGWWKGNLKAKLPGILLQQWPLPNVWLMVSVENQAMANERIPYLLDSPAAIRGLSIEPQVGAVDLEEVSVHGHPLYPFSTRDVSEGYTPLDTVDALRGTFKVVGDSYTTDARTGKIDWIIVGGESGTGARPMYPEWPETLRDAAVEAGTKFFMKQWGQYGTTWQNMDTGVPVFRGFNTLTEWINKASTRVNGGTCVDSAGNVLKNGGDFQKAWDGGRFPVYVMDKLGKLKSGRLLGGRTWDEMPTLAHLVK